MSSNLTGGPKYTPVAQLDERRVSTSETWGFESLRACQIEERWPSLARRRFAKPQPGGIRRGFKSLSLRQYRKVPSKRQTRFEPLGSRETRGALPPPSSMIVRPELRVAEHRSPKPGGAGSSPAGRARNSASIAQWQSPCFVIRRRGIVTYWRLHNNTITI